MAIDVSLRRNYSSIIRMLAFYKFILEIYMLYDIRCIFILFSSSVVQQLRLIFAINRF
jgi:hypothetical protein